MNSMDSLYRSSDDKVIDAFYYLVLFESDKKQLDMVLKDAQESLQQVFDVLQGNVTTAETTINVMTDPDALILIDVCDSRKSVKAAVKERGLLLAEDHATTEEVGEN